MDKRQTRLRRARKTRARIAEQKVARLTIYRSNCHIYAQIIDADGEKVLASASTLAAAEAKTKAAKGKQKAKEPKQQVYGGNIQAATLVGKNIAEKAKSLGIQNVAFDRSGFKYHGRVKALADAARENGLVF
jgi:large subunit ribosomal protein L18